MPRGLHRTKLSASRKGAKLPTNTVEILRKTIKELEQKSGLSPDDPNLAEIERNLLRVTAELELS